MVYDSKSGDDGAEGGGEMPAYATSAKVVGDAGEVQLYDNPEGWESGPNAAQSAVEAIYDSIVPDDTYWE